MDVLKSIKKHYFKVHNCFESILYGFKENKLLVIPKTAIHCAKKFRDKVIDRDCVCGIVIGCVFIIGLKYNKVGIREILKREKIFYTKFKKKFKSLTCKMLTKNWEDNFESRARKNFCIKIMEEIIPEFQNIIK